MDCLIRDAVDEHRFVGVLWANGDSHTVKWDGVVCRSPVWEHDSFVENQIEYVKILDSKNCCDCSVVCADTFDAAKKNGIEEE